MRTMRANSMEHAEGEFVRCPCTVAGVPCGAPSRSKGPGCVVMSYASTKPDHTVEVVKVIRKCSGPFAHTFGMEYTRIVPDKPATCKP